MSFIDDIVDFGSSVIGFFQGNTIGSSIARSALLGYALNQVYDSINAENQIDQTKEIDQGVRLQVNPNTEYKIPVVYGTAIMGGAVTDARITNANGTMFYCLTLCEKTGLTDLGSGADSEFTFGQIYWNSYRLAFASNGIDVIGYYDNEENFVENLNGQVKVYLYQNGSENPVVPTGYTNSSLSNAYDVMPDWDNTYLMSDLVFAIVRVDYNAEKDVKGLGDMKFEVRNSMNKPGDCLFDYMNNSRYGGNIAVGDIHVS